MLRKNKIFYNFEPTRLIGGTQKDMLGIPYVLNVSGTRKGFLAYLSGFLLLIL